MENVNVIRDTRIQEMENYLYPYQRECIESTDKSNRGIVSLPTGTGKTMVQAFLIAMDIIKNPGFGMYVINAPRIMLSYQLLKEVYTNLIKYGVDARYMAVHSGGGVDNQDISEVYNDSKLNYAQIDSTTSPNVIKDFILSVKDQNLPLIFLSTYNSAERISDACKRIESCENIRVICNDEAHYLVQEQFHDILSILKSDRCYFFTATTIYHPSEKGRGMNNVSCYGEVIYKMSPLEAIRLGKMVRPRVHYVVNKDNKYINNGQYTSSSDFIRENIGVLVKETFMQHTHALDGLSPKMLISVDGTETMVNFLKSKECLELRRKGVKIFAVSSNDEVGNITPNCPNPSDRASRQQFLEELKEAGKDTNVRLIVFHYDILAEGIDVPGLTGVLPLRSLAKSKFLQTFGRVARLDVTDRQNIADKVIDPENFVASEYNKPYAWIIVPSIVSDHDDNKSHFYGLIRELRSENFNISELIVVTSDGGNGISKKEGPEALNQLDTSGNTTIGEKIDEIEARYEEERIAAIMDEEAARLAALSDDDWFNEVVNG